MKRQIFVLITALLLTTAAGAHPVNWTLAHPALHPISLAGSGVLGNYLYVFNGYNSNTGQAFNINTELWEESTPAPLWRWDWAGVATDRAVYLIAGYYGGTQWNVQKFTPTGGGPTGTWMPVAHYPFPAGGVAAAWDGGNYIYAAGGDTGINQDQPTKAAFKYDTSTYVWMQIDSMPIPMGFAGGAFVLGKFYVVGGFDNPFVLLTYDPGSNTWEQKASAPEGVPLGTFCTTFSDSLIYTVGGGDAPEGAPASDGVQIYNPLTDSWYQETPLPVPVSQNIARWVGGGKIISAGGCIGTSFTPQDTIWKGTGFPSSMPSIYVTLSPINPPITIPAGGGSFNFKISVIRTVGPQSQYTVWARIKNPNGTYTAPTLGPVTINTPVGVTITRQRTQTVPGTWAAGLYTYLGYVNPTYSYPAVDSSSFTWTKSTTADGGPWITEASCTGEPFPGEEVANLQPTAFSLLKASPNPFNPTALISFELAAASHVSLKVYDISGKVVVTLVDGIREAGTNETTFDGSNLSSGIYFCRLQAGGITVVQKLMLLK